MPIGRREARSSPSSSARRERTSRFSGGQDSRHETAGWIQDPRFSPDGSTDRLPRSLGIRGRRRESPSSTAPERKPSSPAGGPRCRGSPGRPEGARSGSRRPARESSARSGPSRSRASSAWSGRCRGPRHCSTSAGTNALVTEDDYRASVLAFLPGQSVRPRSGLVRLVGRPRSVRRREASSLRRVGRRRRRQRFGLPARDRRVPGRAPGRRHRRDALARQRLGRDPHDLRPAALRPRAGQGGSAPRVPAGRTRETPVRSLPSRRVEASSSRRRRRVMEPGCTCSRSPGGPPAPISAEGINAGRLFVSPDARWSPRPAPT